jgi:hypothetical protein
VPNCLTACFPGLIEQLLHTDATLWELLDTPLMLNIVTLAYRNHPEAVLHTDRSLEARRQHLFAAYIDRMFRRRHPATSYKREQTLHWLTWLARQMAQRSLMVFYIERMQPDWFPDLQKWRGGVRLSIGLVFGLLGGLSIGLVFELLGGLSVGLIAGVVAGLRVRPGEDIAPTETVLWSWRAARLGVELRAGLLFGLDKGLFVGLRAGVILALFFGLIFTLGFGLFGGQHGGVESIFPGGLFSGEIETKAIPNQGIRRSARHALFFGLSGGLGLGLFTALLFGLFFGVRVGLFFGLRGSPETDPYRKQGLRGKRERV